MLLEWLQYNIKFYSIIIKHAITINGQLLNMVKISTIETLRLMKNFFLIMIYSVHTFHCSLATYFTLFRFIEICGREYTIVHTDSYRSIRRGQSEYLDEDEISSYLVKDYIYVAFYHNCGRSVHLSGVSAIAYSANRS